MRAALLAGLILAGGLGGCATPPRTDATPERAGVPDAPVLFVIDRGWHTDVALAASALPDTIAALRRKFPGARYFVFGFGDRAWLLARHVSLGETIGTLFPSPAALLVTALRDPPGDAFGDVHVATLRLTCAQLHAATNYVAHAFATDTPVSLGDGPYPGSAFYATGQIYSLIHNCNRWTADAIRATGLPIQAQGVIVDGQVISQARELAAMTKTVPAAPCS